MGFLKKTSTDGGEVAVLGQSRGLTGNLAIAHGCVLWIEPGFIRKANLDGTGNHVLASSPWPRYLAVDVDFAYFTDVRVGTVNRVPIGGGPVTALASDLRRPTALAIDTSHVYFTEWPENMPGAGTVNRIPIRGGPIEVIATGQDCDASAIAIDPNHVYWPNSPRTDATLASTLNRAPLAGGPVEIVASVPRGGNSICLSGPHMYWAAIGSVDGTRRGSIGRVSKDGADPTTLAAELDSPDLVTADGACVYWVSLASGAVFKLSK
jgi:hypothetical protein